jgi:hypothetical protein
VPTLAQVGAVQLWKLGLHDLAPLAESFASRLIVPQTMLSHGQYEKRLRVTLGHLPDGFEGALEPCGCLGKPPQAIFSQSLGELKLSHLGIGLADGYSPFGKIARHGLIGADTRKEEIDLGGTFSDGWVGG